MPCGEGSTGGRLELLHAGTITLGEGSSALRDAIRGLNAKGRTKILLNLSEVSYIDSAGMSELISGYISATNQSGTVKLPGLTKRVKDPLQITKLYTFSTFTKKKPTQARVHFLSGRGHSRRFCRCSSTSRMKRRNCWIPSL